ncbi:MAG: thioredoxin family protein [Candidatus Woesearchaeota archaeon]
MKRVAKYCLCALLVVACEKKDAMEEIPGPSRVVHITAGSFDEEVLEAELPVMVDFSSENCHYCREVEPVVEHLSKEYYGRMKVVELKVTRDDYWLMEQYKFYGVPAFRFFYEGLEYSSHRISGAREYPFFKEEIGDFLEEASDVAGGLGRS